jgi:hypothetical protein
MFTAEAYAVLESGLAIDGRKVRLLGDLEAGVYQEVRAAFVRFGARYKGRRGHNEHFLFAVDPEPVIASMLAHGEANPLDFYGTPAGVAEELLDLADLDALPIGARILEPSAGLGALVDAILARMGTHIVGRTLDVVEHNASFCEHLRAKYAGLGGRLVEESRERYGGVDEAYIAARAAECEAFAVNVIEADFLKYTADQPYQLIVMNPPFNADGQDNVYIQHIMHAWGMLADDGLLVAVTPTGWQFGEVSRESRFWTINPPQSKADFKRFVMEYGGHAVVEAGAFKESGTGSRVGLVVLQKGFKSFGDLAYERSMSCQDRDGHVNYSTFALRAYYLMNGALSQSEQAEVDRLESARRTRGGRGWSYSDSKRYESLMDGGAAYERIIAMATGYAGPERLFDAFGYLVRGRIDWADIVAGFREHVAECEAYDAENKAEQARALAAWAALDVDKLGAVAVAA